MNRRYLFGEWLESAAPLTPNDLAAICDRAEEEADRFARYPVEDVLRLLGRMRNSWARPDYPRRMRLRASLPAEMGLSGPMVELGLERLAGLLNPEPLRQKIATELRGLPRRPAEHFNAATHTGLHWEPLGVVLHVLASNGFLGAAGSLIEGLLTGNVSLLKMPATRRVFLQELVESLQESDEDGVVSRSLALIDVPSSDQEALTELKTRVDGIVVWGGEEAVRAFRADLPARTRLIVFGPKLSFAFITARGLARAGVETVAAKLAAEIAIWDQSACTAPQLCYVETEEAARELVEATARALALEAERLPPGEADPDTAIEIQKLRGLHRIAEARGEGMLRAAPNGVGWTVMLSRDLSPEGSPLHRTLRIVPFRSSDDVLHALGGIKGYLQTVGMVAEPDERSPLTARFARLGATRLVDLGRMSTGQADDPHDGAYDLPQLMNLVTTRFAPATPTLHPFETLSVEERDARLDEGVRQLVELAREREVYARRLNGLSIRGRADLPLLAPLTRAEMEQNIPPRGNGLGTGEWRGGYVSRSGGSGNGEPVFSIYDGPDWERLVASAVRLFESLGLQPGDRVANCMRAGDLYGGFISFDHINHRLGVTSFALATSTTAETLVDLWRKFAVNVVQGVPAWLMPILREAKRLEPRLAFEKIVYGGTPLSPVDERWLRDELGARRIASVVGANDGGQIAYQCEAMSGFLHHTVDDYNFLEIVDDRGQPLPEGEVGNILITTLAKHAFPLLRYEIGDTGRFVPGLCPCGRTSRRLEYYGRSGQPVKVGPVTTSFLTLRRALERLPLSELQLVLRRDSRGEGLLLRAETESTAPDLSDEIRARLRAGIEGLASGPWLDIEILPPGGIPRNVRSIKLPAIVDER